MWFTQLILVAAVIFRLPFGEVFMIDFSILLHHLGLASVGILIFMTLAFGVAQLRQRYDTADIAWGLGFVVVACLSLLTGQQSWRGLLTLALVSIWGFRLATHIYLRHRNRPEDRRYQDMRAKWQSNVALRAWLQIFLSQGVLLLLIAFPIVVINTSISSSITIFDVLGVLVWTVGFVFESVGDAQLSSFTSNPANKGKLMTSGLWSYTRHPNYFGEITQWWGIWLLALSVPYGLLAIIGPLTITILITKVSGVPLLEKAYAGRPDWEAYKKRTSVLVPWRPIR